LIIDTRYGSKLIDHNKFRDRIKLLLNQNLVVNCNNCYKEITKDELDEIYPIGYSGTIFNLAGIFVLCKKCKVIEEL